ncbi:hypothetical protein D3C73_815840 [compost metagenome]
MAIILDRKHGLADRHLDLGKDVGDIATHHHPHDRILQRLRQSPASHSAAIAKNHEILGDLIDLIELVADEQDRLALLFQSLDDAKQIVDLLAGEGSGRLVHDDDLCLDRQCAGNGYEMSLRNRKIFQPNGRIDLAFQHMQQFGGARIHHLPVDQTETRARRMPKKNVFRNR